MKTLKQLGFLIATLGVLALAVPGGRLLAQPADVPEVERAGVIHELDRATNQLVIDGVRYRVALDAVVRTRGAQSDFSMLRTEMKVAFSYRVYPDHLEIFLIEQLPDNTVLEEV